MFAKRLRHSVVAIAGALFVLTVDSASARAGSITFADAHGAMWQASWTQPLTVLNFTGPQMGGAGIGTFTKTAVFNPGVTSLDITFSQLTASAMPDNNKGPGNDFGLRFTLDEIVTNRTGIDWTGFKEQFIEVTPVTAKDRRDFPDANPHPWFAHFHNFAADNFNPAQFKLVGDFPDAQDTLVVSGGPVKGNGGKWTPTGIGIHERIFGDVFGNGVGRQFILRESWMV